MNKNAILALVLSLAVALGTSMPALAMENTNCDISENSNNVVKYEFEVECVGNDIMIRNIELLDNGMLIITQELSESENDVNQFRSIPEREKTKTFTHSLVDRNGIELAVLHSTVTGIYSQVDNDAYLTNISGHFTGDFAHDLSYSSSISGDTGSIYLYWNGVHLHTYTYKIFPNGTIQYI